MVTAKHFAYFTAAFVLFGFGSTAKAALTVPYGLQSDISQATVNGWGWTEIHRSNASQPGVPQSSIDAAATGDYLMMGVWDTDLQQYSILGAGETSVVTAITYTDVSGDDNQNFNPNFSNGLNFYRTQTYGSWGFTTNKVTQLNFADVFLINGLSNHNGPEGTLSRGLSFHTTLGDFVSGWAFNATGNDLTVFGDDRYERVFFTGSLESVVPEPATLVVWAGLGLVASGTFYAKKRKSALSAV